MNIADWKFDCPVKIDRGGMSVGITSNAVRATHVPTGVSATVQARSQFRSKIIAQEMVEYALSHGNEIEVLDLTQKETTK